MATKDISHEHSTGHTMRQGYIIPVVMVMLNTLEASMILFQHIRLIIVILLIEISTVPSSPACCKPCHSYWAIPGWLVRVMNVSLNNTLEMLSVEVGADDHLSKIIKHRVENCRFSVAVLDF